MTNELKPTQEQIEAAVCHAVEIAIDEMGIEGFKKCSFFISNGVG